jgi:N-dimethylarginine dimethylaminohydrolase
MQKILMCAPDYFGVDYVINPWMEGQRGKTDNALVVSQWEQLRAALANVAELACMAPQPGLPDLVFTANAAFVIGKRAVISRFSSKERQGEEPFFRDWFKNNGFELADWPADLAFEGAGDALLDRGETIIWVGHGFRSDAAAAGWLEQIFERRAVPLHLVDPRFYHLDTCLCPLEGGYVMYFPPAFDAASQQAIIDHVPENRRIVISEDDATRFACNAVDLKHHVFVNHASPALQSRLRDANFTPVTIPLSEFMRSGGAAKCLTLKLHEN